jgi:hypothetical protein
MLGDPVLPEAEVVRRVATETNLLTHGASARLRIVHASEFTRAVAVKLKPRGWGLLYKTVGLNIDLISVDSVVHRDTGDVAVVVTDVGHADARPCWQLRPAGCAANWIDPEAPDAMRLVLSRHEVSLLDIQRAVHRVLELLMMPAPRGRFPDGSSQPGSASRN